MNVNLKNQILKLNKSKKDLDWLKPEMISIESEQNIQVMLLSLIVVVPQIERESNIPELNVCF